MAPLSDPAGRITAALGRRYAIERELGRGGMGTVYLALDRKHDRRVAIKVLPPEVAAALGSERFLREIRIAARLSHPHILPLHDSGEAAGMLYYVMPFVEGESLRERLAREHRLPLTDSLAIAREVADALAHAHSQNVVHRDVKPANILLAGGHALLADFGVAKAVAGVAGQEVLTDSGLQPGTAAYASPEQAAGSREVDHRSDIYSLGCVLTEMLGAQSGGIPDWVGRALARATAHNPADRFASAAEFRLALAEPAPEPRRRLAWMAAGAVALTLVAAAAAFLPSRTARADPRKVVVARFENRTGDSALAPVGDIATDYMARGLAATRLMHDVFDLRVSALEAGERAQPGPAAARELANRVGAGTVLWGSYYVQEDSLRLEAQLIDAPTGKTLLSLEPAVGSLGEKTRAVEVLRQRVMAGFATLVGANFESWTAASVPPTYEAYREMLEGDAARLSFGWKEAAAHYQRAATLDSSYSGAHTARALVLSLDRNCEAVDSIARGLAGRTVLLPLIDRGQLDYAIARCRNDGEAALAASRVVLMAEPRSVSFAVLGAVAALEELHPRQALEVLRLHDPERARIKQPALGMYLDWLTMTYHMLGDYRRQLEAARSDLRSAPNARRKRSPSPGSAGRLRPNGRRSATWPSATIVKSSGRPRRPSASRSSSGPMATRTHPGA